MYLGLKCTALKAEGETFYELGKVVPGHKETIMKGGVFGA